MLKYALLIAICFVCFNSASAQQQEKENENAIRDSVLDSMLFEATMNDVTDANLFENDGWIYTASELNRKRFETGIRTDKVKIVKGGGVSGSDFLRFKKKTKPVLFYKAAKTLAMRPKENWQGTVSFWLRLDPEKLEKGYVDPLIITQKAWNDGAFWVDFDNVKPRTFRLGAFSDLEFWNPKGTKWDDVPEKERPIITVNQLPFAEDKWTHVAFTFSGINTKDDSPGEAKLYLDGELQGTIKRAFKFTWDEKAKPISAAMLGVGYSGDFDHLTFFGKALTDKQIRWIHKSGEAIH